MQIDPKLSPQQIAALSAEILLCQRLLRKLWCDEARHNVMARRRHAYRLLYDLPLGIPLPIDWQPSPSPQAR